MQGQHPYGPYGPPPGAGPPPAGWGQGYGPPPGFTPPPAGSFGGPPPSAYGPRVDGMAVSGLILGILGLVGGLLNLISGLFGTFCVLCTIGSTFIGIVSFLPSAAGVGLGVFAEKRIRSRPARYTGRGLAIAAIVVAGLAALLAIVEIVLPWFGIGCLYATGSIKTPP